MLLRISLAGRVSIRTEETLIDEQRFPGRQGRLVFAYLVSEHGRPVLRDDLAAALWGETPPATWEKALGGIVSKLRALLGECGLDGAAALTAAFGCYRLELPEGSWVDLTAAAEAADAATAALAAGRFDTAKLEAARAASLARPPLLPGEYGSWVDDRRRRLADVLVCSLECHCDACLQTGDASDAARSAEEAIALEPFRESNYRRLMQAHAAAGNTAEALRAYERCRRFLAEELGAYPSRETEAVYRELLQVSPAAPPAVDAPPADVAASRRQRPRPRVVAVVALAVAALATGLGLVLIGTGGSSTHASLGANAIGLIDPGNGRVVAAIDGGAAPGEVAAAPDAIWVTNPNDNTVSLIEPETNDVRQTIQVGGGPAGVAVGGKGVWVANGLDGTVSHIDAAANRVVQTITVGNGPRGVAYGERGVWVTNSADGTVSEVDPDTGRVRRTLPAVIGASGIAVAFGRLWIASPPAGIVVAVDPRSGRVLKRIGVGVDPDAVAAGAGAVWVVNRADSTVSRIDPRSAAVTDTVEVGRRPSGIAAGSAGVWVANRGDGSLSRIDPSRGETTQTVRLGNPPLGVAVAPQGIYVAVGSTGREHDGGRLRILDINPVHSIDFALSRPTLWPLLIVTNDGLVGFRRVGGVQGSQLVADLAVALPTPTDAGTTYTFQLRPGIRYSNGALVQPEDFKRAIERIFEVGGVEYAYYYTGILGAQRCTKGRPCDLWRGILTDRATRTVTFHLTTADPDFLAKLALPPAFAVPAGASMRGRLRIPATGPYRIAEFRPEARTIRLVRNSRFRAWSSDAQPSGYADSISWSWTSPADPVAAVRAVERGAADVALGGTAPLSKPQLDMLGVRHPNQLHVSTQRGTAFFFLNTRVPPFDDVRARKAVNYAVDRDALARLLGPAFGPTCQILPPNFPGYRHTCRYVSDIDKARRLVRESHTHGARVIVRVPTSLTAQGRYMVTVLNTIGYRARLKPINREAYYPTVSNSAVRPQIGYYTWSAAYPSAADFIPPQLSCAAFVPASAQNGNLAEFCDASIDAEIARAVNVQRQDPAAATGLWRQIEQSLLSRAPVVPTYNQRQVDFVSTRLGNYEYNPQWGLLLAQVWVR